LKRTPLSGLVRNLRKNLRCFFTSKQFRSAAQQILKPCMDIRKCSCWSLPPPSLTLSMSSLTNINENKGTCPARGCRLIGQTVPGTPKQRQSKGGGAEKEMRAMQNYKNEQIVTNFICFCSATILTSKIISESVDNHFW